MSIGMLIVIRSGRGRAVLLETEKLEDRAG